MESSKLILVTSLLAVLGPLAAFGAPGLFDVFNWGQEKAVGGSSLSAAKSDAGTRSDRRCVCDGSWCRCCVDLSLAGYIDVGGPGCIDMRYISQTEGVKLNMTYGDTRLQGAQVKVGNAVPICMDLLSDLAQVCASMKNLRNEGDGLYGCASLEPILLGDVQEDYSFGCFNMGQAGIVPDVENVTTTESSEEEEEETTEQPTSLSTLKPDVNEETLITAINASAEDGIAWFTGLLGDIFGGNKGNTEQVISSPNSPAQAAPTVTSPSASSPAEAAPQPAPSELPQENPSVPQQRRSLSLQRQMYNSEIP